MNASWPWLMLAGLGAFHGINPAMGWLFAVALGLHRRSRAVVLRSLIPIAIGHALAIGIVVAVVVAAGIAVGDLPLRRAAACVLILWAAYQTRYGARHRVRIGMRAGFAGLLGWSFLMSGAHGAGPMLAPAVIPLCLGMGAPSPIATTLTAPLLAVAVHTTAMLSVTAAIAVLVYDWFGLEFLRHGWLNLDRIWIAALFATGLLLFATG
jgi:hypothetical protein